VRLWRVFPFDSGAGEGEAGGALWFPRGQQGTGRHDNPELYGCLYLSEEPVSAMAERLAPFRGTGAVLASMLVRVGLPLALAAVELLDDAPGVDLDDPGVLLAEGLRPSGVATRQRGAMQGQAAAIHGSHPDAVGIRWWSTLEASWINWTLFDRVGSWLSVTGIEVLNLDHPVVREAAEFVGLRSRRG
jgi:hypothetical protein